MRALRLAALASLLLGGAVAHAGGLEPTMAPENTDAGPVEAGGLDLDSVQIPEASVKKVEVAGNDRSGTWAVLAVVTMVGAVGAAGFAGRRSGATPPRLSLPSAPLSAKLALSLLLAVYGATHVVAAVTVYFDTRVVYESTAEYFRFMKPARLSALSHAHLMGIATMDGIAALLFAWSRRSGAFSCAIVTMAFVGVIGDIGSWWLIKYAGAGFELLSVATGAFFSLGFLIMAACLLYDTWLRRPEVQK